MKKHEMRYPTKKPAARVTHADIDEQVEQFLANGGTIERLPGFGDVGRTGTKVSLHPWQKPHEKTK